MPRVPKTRLSEPTSKMLFQEATAKALTALPAAVDAMLKMVLDESAQSQPRVAAFRALAELAQCGLDLDAIEAKLVNIERRVA